MGNQSGDEQLVDITTHRLLSRTQPTLAPMNKILRPSWRTSTASPRTGCAALLAVACLSASCVTHNVTTGEAVPREGQKYPFEKVEKAAERLQVGLTKAQVLMMLGSPAESDSNHDVWIYLPERYGILVPARALRLQFADEVLAEYGYRPIVLGTQL